ncbi:lipocalin family protein [Flagellimonas crocea]|uniref:lipocalin family protein n=1 Tax=Flagellimonas crocea TaxID=3067311 RepID=UPI002970074F|nr:lipocalin family protein [Muricauda sp. DH64]
MKKLFVHFLLFGLMVLSVGCDESNGDNSTSQNSLTGKWKMTAAYISAGGPQYWVTVEDGEEIEFFANGTFISSRNPECRTGTYVVEGEELSLEFDCDGFESVMENEEGLITYNIEFNKNEFLLSPTSILCIEGCSYKYVKNE